MDSRNGLELPLRGKQAVLTASCASAEGSWREPGASIGRSHRQRGRVKARWQSDVQPHNRWSPSQSCLVYSSTSIYSPYSSPLFPYTLNLPRPPHSPPPLVLAGTNVYGARWKLTGFPCILQARRSTCYRPPTSRGRRLLHAGSRSVGHPTETQPQAQRSVPPSGLPCLIAKARLKATHHRRSLIRLN